MNSPEKKKKKNFIYLTQFLNKVQNLGGIENNASNSKCHSWSNLDSSLTNRENLSVTFQFQNSSTKFHPINILEEELFRTC